MTKSTWVHLRLPFSWVLAPVSLFALAAVRSVDFTTAFWTLVVQFLCLYPASHAFNSYYDKDEESIGGIEKPPPATKELLWVALALDLVGLVVAFFAVGAAYCGFVFIYGLASKAYSHPAVRWKASPVFGWLVVSFMQGFFTFAMVAIAQNPAFFTDPSGVFLAVVSSFWIGSAYPLTQVYQHKEDARRGDRTLSLLLGGPGTLVFVGAGFALSQALLGGWAILYGDWLFFSAVQLGFLPAGIYFVRHWLWSRDAFFQYRTVMRMTFLSATGINLALIFMVGLNSIPSAARLVESKLQSRLRNLTLLPVVVKVESLSWEKLVFSAEVPGESPRLGPFTLEWRPSSWTWSQGKAQFLLEPQSVEGKGFGVRGLEARGSLEWESYWVSDFLFSFGAEKLRSGKSSVEQVQFRLEASRKQSRAHLAFLQGGAFAASYQGGPLEKGKSLRGKGPFQLVTPEATLSAILDWAILESGRHVEVDFSEGRVSVPRLKNLAPRFSSHWLLEDSVLRGKAQTSGWEWQGLDLGTLALSTTLDTSAWQLELDLNGAGDLSTRPQWNPLGLKWKGAGVFPVLKGAGELTDSEGSRILGFSTESDISKPQLELSINENWVFSSEPLSRYGEALAKSTIKEGTLALQARAFVGSGKPLKSSGQIRFSNVGGNLEGTPFRGLSGDTQAASLFPFTLIKASTVRVAEIGSQVPLTHLAIHLEPQSKGITRVGVQGDWAKGKLTSEKGLLNAALPSFFVELALSGVDFETLLSAFEMENLKGQGILEGRLPLDFRPKGLFIKDGKLASSGSGGWIRYQTPLGATGSVDYLDQLEMLLAQGQQALAFKALDDFHFTRLQADINRAPKTGLDAVLKLAGRNPELGKGQPIEFNIRLGGQLETALKRSLFRAPESYAKEWEKR